MGLGEFPCGSGACGLDPQTPQERTLRRPPAALHVDGQTQDFALDSQGLYRDAHPVDAKVWLGLRTVLGSIRSAPDAGNGVALISYIDRAKHRATVEDRIRRVTDPMEAAGEIRVLRVEIDLTVPGRTMFAVDYQNLASNRRERATA